MLFRLFLLFTLMPLIELWLLTRLSDVFGWPTTIIIVLLTGFVGAWLAKMQGWLAMFRVRTELTSGKMPTEAMGDGVMILVAGVLLITPGVLTDIFGLSLLLPPVRSIVRNLAMAWIKKNVRIETTAFTGSPFGQSSQSAGPLDPNVVEGRVVDAHVVENEIKE